MKRTFLTLAALVVPLLVGNNPVHAAVWYTVTDLGTLGGAESYAMSINNAGQISGYSFRTGSADRQAFIYSGGVMHDLNTSTYISSQAMSINADGQVIGFGNLDANTRRALIFSGGAIQELGTLGGTASSGSGINASGQIVGNSTLPESTNFHAFLYSSGAMQDLGTLGGTRSAAIGINDAGLIVGYSRITGSTTEHAFLYSNGKMQDLGTLGGNSSQAWRINNSGQIVGYSKLGNDTHAFLYSDGTMKDLGVLAPGHGSQATSINNLGNVVGFDFNSSPTYTSTAILYSNGTLTELNSLILPGSNWSLTAAWGINDLGQIVGNGANPAGQNHAFLLTPITQQTASVPGTGQQSVSIGGGASQAGGLVAQFSNITEIGSLNVQSAPANLDDMLNGDGPFGAGPVNFALPTGANNVQTWDIVYSGSFSGLITLTFAYDPTGLTAADQQALQIYHWTKGQWDNLGGLVNLDAHTITVNTNSLSPFALGITAVPEPASLSILVFGGLALLQRKRR